MRTFPLLLAFVLSGALAACDGGDPSPSTGPPPDGPSVRLRGPLGTVQRWAGEGTASYAVNLDSVFVGNPEAGPLSFEAGGDATFELTPAGRLTVRFPDVGAFSVRLGARGGGAGSPSTPSAW